MHRTNGAFQRERQDAVISRIPREVGDAIQMHFVLLGQDRRQRFLRGFLRLVTFMETRAWCYPPDLQHMAASFLSVGRAVIVM